MPKTTIEFSERSADNLNRLARSLETSKVEVLRSALTLYSYVAKEIGKQPNKFLGIIGDRDEIDTILVVPGLQDKEKILKMRANGKSMIVTAGK